MKILHVVTSIVRGGAETEVVELARGQARRGDRVVVTYLKGEPYWQRALAEGGVATHPLGLIRYGDPMPALRLRALLWRQKPDIVHAHLPPAELYARAAIAGSSRTFVITRHNDGPFFRGPGERAFAGWAARRARRIVAISDAVRRRIEHDTPAVAGAARVIPYGIDPAPFAAPRELERGLTRLRWNAPDDTLVVGTVARLVPQKALDVLIHGFAAWSKTTTRSVRLVIVGYGPLEAELKQRAADLGVDAVVVFDGFREDIPAVMQAFDIFALTSEYEGLGLVLLEAMAAARPVVATAVSAIPEVVAGGETGLLFPAGDHTALAERLTALEDESLRTRLGNAGRERVAATYSIDRMVDATGAVYREALGKGV